MSKYIGETQRIYAGSLTRLNAVAPSCLSMKHMAGHEGGILTFGKDLKEAFAVLVREREQRILR